MDPSVASVTVAASAIDSKATIAGTGTVDLQSGVNEITVTVKAANGNLRNYVLHVVRQSGGRLLKLDWKRRFLWKQL